MKKKRGEMEGVRVNLSLPVTVYADLRNLALYYGFLRPGTFGRKLLIDAVKRNRDHLAERGKMIDGAKQQDLFGGDGAGARKTPRQGGIYNAWQDG